MPPLSDRLKTQTLGGFEAVETPNKMPPPVTVPGADIGSNPYIRCPLPPFAVNIDTTRQFNESGKIPARRVIPLSAASQLGGTYAIKESVFSTSSGSSGGGSSSGGTTLTSKSVLVSVPALAPSQSFRVTVQMAKSFQLLQMNSTQSVEVRMYGNALAQTSDIARPSDSAVPFEISSNIITDVIFDTAPRQWNWQNRVGANADASINAGIYLSVINPSSTTGVPASTVTIVFLPLES